MPNGECAVGSANRARIENLEKEQGAQRMEIQKVSEKIDRINWWLVAVLGGVAMNLILQLATTATKGAGK